MSDYFHWAAATGLRTDFQLIIHRDLSARELAYALRVMRLAERQMVREIKRKRAAVCSTGESDE